jgi:hypothetical protein
LNAWSGGSKDDEDENGMEIGDDTVDYDDYDDVEKVRQAPPSPRKMAVDAEAVAEKYFMKSPPPSSSSSSSSSSQEEVKKDEGKKVEAADGKKKSKTFLQALAVCKDMVCVREAHLLPREEGVTYNFPHFLIIGFQKAATTSLHVYVWRMFLRVLLMLTPYTCISVSAGIWGNMMML